MTSGPAEPGLTTIKTLFAFSNNLCAFMDPDTKVGCEEPLTDPKWKQVKARICHIEGEAPTSARYREEMTDDERAHYDNLILLCPNHHTQIDDCEPERFTVAALKEAKRLSEEHGEPTWASDEFLERAAQALQLTMERLRGLPRLEPVPLTRPMATSSTPAEAGPTGRLSLSSDITASSDVTAHGLTANVDVTAAGPAASVSADFGAGGGGFVRGFEDDPRIIQIKQILGYDEVTGNVQGGGGALDIFLQTPLTDDARNQLQVLAQESNSLMRFHYENSVTEFPNDFIVVPTTND